jgi:hypothetical protein
MERNDKILREKLSQYQAPFDASAWNKMERLLNRKKKRRGLFWWWSGTTLAAALAALGLVLWVPEPETQTSEMIAWKAESATSATPHLPQPNNYRTASQTIENTPPSTSLPEDKSAEKNNTPTAFSQSTTAQKFTHKPTAAVKQIRSCSKKAASAPSITPASTTSTAKLFAEVKPIHSLPASPMHLPDHERELQKNEESGSVSLPVKKKKYRYELGVQSGVSFIHINNHLTERYSWYLGVQENYRFGKYFSFSDGIYYHQTTFGQQFSGMDSSDNLKSYRTTFHALSIAIGLNVYPVSTRKVDWYLGAAFFHHFKVRERIDYELDFQKSSAEILGFDNSVVNVDKGYSRQTISENELRKGYGTKFYTAGFYSSTGIEAKLYRGLRINVGFQYQMGLWKSIDKQSHPHYVGGELGLRYRF